MAKSAAEPLVFPSAQTQKQNSSGPVLAPVVDIDVRHIGRKTTQAFPGIHAPEGWVKKEDRQREGKVWIGYFHLWTQDHTGRRVRTKKEKKRGPATMPKHEAQQKLADYIEEYTGKLIRQGGIDRNVRRSVEGLLGGEGGFLAVNMLSPKSR